MARYIDADALKMRLEMFSKWCRDGRKQGVDFVLDCPLPDMPTVDVVKVVRCKDCKHKVVTSDGEYNPEDIVCDYHASDGFDSNDFCSYGEKAAQQVVDANSAIPTSEVEKLFAEVNETIECLKACHYNAFESAARSRDEAKKRDNIVRIQTLRHAQVILNAVKKKYTEE